MIQGRRMPSLAIFWVIGALFGTPAIARAESSRWTCLKNQIAGLIEDHQQLKKARDVVKRNLSHYEQRAYLEAALWQKEEFLAPEVIAKQDGDLLTGGFNKQEIQNMREAGLLGGEPIRWVEPVPTEIRVAEAHFVEIDPSVIEAAKNGAKFRYVVDGADEVRLIREWPQFTEDALWFLKDVSDGEANKSTLVKESGEFTYDPETKGFRLKPDYSIELTEAEAKASLDHVSEKTSIQFERQGKKKNSKKKLLDCLAILAANQAGKSFLFDRIIAENVVMGSVILVQDALGAGRLSTKTGRDRVVADFAVNNASTMISSPIYSKLLINDQGLALQLGTRAAVGMGLIEGQRQMYKFILPGNAKKDKEKDKEKNDYVDRLTRFNQIHFLAKIPINHYLDKQILQTLPMKLVGACQRGAKLKVLVSPRAIRIYERFGSTMIYYGLKNAIVDDQ